MKTSRRVFLRGAAAFFPPAGDCAAGFLLSNAAGALDRCLAPGGIADLLAHVMGQWLTGKLGQPFVIENCPGGGTNIGTETVVRSAPDGHTLLLVSLQMPSMPVSYDKLNFNFIRDIAPAAGPLRAPNVMVVHPSIPARTVPESVIYAKARPERSIMHHSGLGPPFTSRVSCLK
jgi:tripartite-type tricarboxylate transporter receptor subunit TctC